MFEKEVGIDIHNRVIAYLHATLATRRVGIDLHSVLPNVGGIVRRIIACKIANIGSEIAM